MNKGAMFERDGKTFEALQSGLEHIKRNRSACIRPKGASACITIPEALKQGLIRESPATSDTKQTADDLFMCAKNESTRHVEEKTAVSEERRVESYTTHKDRLSGDNTYFMPVDELRAQVFLVHGLLYPPVYDRAGAAADFADNQGLSPGDISLFETPQPLKKRQVLLKILLHPDEVADADRVGGTLRLATPLPISRLVGISLPASAGPVERYVNGWEKPDLPVPRHLFSGDAPEAREQEAPSTSQATRRNAKQVAETAESVAKFDRYLGIMAFLRNTARYFSQKCGQYADYPDAYLSLAAAVLGKHDVEPSPPTVLEPFLTALLDLDCQLRPHAEIVLSMAKCQDPYIEKEKARDFAMKIYKNTGESETLAQAFKTLFSGDYRSAIRTLQGPGVPPEAAVLAGLFKFSNRQAGDHRTVKQRLHEDWNCAAQVIPVIASLGSFHGYTAMDAMETTLYSVHPLIQPLIEQRPPIKFHLTTIFERQLIEALYQRAFYPKDPDRVSSTLYAGISALPSPTDPKINRILVKDTSYTVRDLLVRRYEVTFIGRLVHRLMLWKRDTIDEQSEVGRCLMAQCFFHADEYDLSLKGGRHTLRYRIPKSKVIDLITNERISVNPRVLEAALQEDAEEVGK